MRKTLLCVVVVTAVFPLIDDLYGSVLPMQLSVFDFCARLPPAPPRLPPMPSSLPSPDAVSTGENGDAGDGSAGGSINGGDRTWPEDAGFGGGVLKTQSCGGDGTAAAVLDLTTVDAAATRCWTATNWIKCPRDLPVWEVGTGFDDDVDGTGASVPFATRRCRVSCGESTS